VGDVEPDLRAGAAGRGKVGLELEDCCLPALRDVLDVELCVEADLGGRIEAGEETKAGLRPFPFIGGGDPGGVMPSPDA